MFERGERNRRADRARMASLAGYVGRNVGDQPYIMDLVEQWHFQGGVALPLHYGQTAVGTGNAVAYSNNAAPTAWKIQSGATASSSFVLDWKSAVTERTFLNGFSRDAAIRSRVQYSAVDSEARLFFGFAVTAGALATATDGLFFGIDGSVSTDYFICVSRNAGVATTAILDGGGAKANIPVDTSWHDVSIVCDSTAGEARVYVDRQLAATITQDLPDDASDYFTPHYSAQNGATATNRSISVDVHVISESAP